MNPSVLQQWIDEFHATSLQQWAFRLVAVVAPLAALLAAAGCRMADSGRPACSS